MGDALFTAIAHATGNLDEDLPVLLRVVAERLGFEVAAMWWWEPEKEVLRCEHVWQSATADCSAFLEGAHHSVLAPGEPVPGAVFLDGEPIWVPDVRSYPNFRRGSVARAAGLRSGVAFPIRAHGETVGVFELFTVERRDLDPALLDVVSAAAAHLGDFIERLNMHAERDRLLGELALVYRRQRFLLEANKALSTARGLSETIDRLARVAAPAIGDLCLLDVLNKEGNIERLTAYHVDARFQDLTDELRQFPPEPDSDHPAAIAIRSGTSHVAHDMAEGFLVSTTQGADHYEIARKLQFTSYVSAPLLSSGRPIGALTVVSAGSGRHFGEEELRLLEELAAQVTSVIERERRFDEQQHVAHILQRSMLPDVKPVDGLDVCARYFASGEVAEIGGDFYDLIHLGPSTVALVIGDVQGHDLVAITTMAKVRNALRAFLQTMRNLDEVLRALDRFVADQPEGRFVTLALARLEVTSGELDVALAGHPSPLLVGEAVEALTCQPGPPVGIAAGAESGRYEISHWHLPVGGGLVFYTDGLVEDPANGPDARLTRFVDAVDRNRLRPLEVACDAVVQETLTGASCVDDVAVIWVARTEVPASEPDPAR
ncbi:MAG: SpoIIE family protein phosphatase [Acidimicrobiales bacterium]|nr:SpoIIE family protein phosphatase [Acidimicrobiales bacterium]